MMTMTMTMARTRKRRMMVETVILMQKRPAGGDRLQLNGKGLEVLETLSFAQYIHIVIPASVSACLAFGLLNIFIFNPFLFNTY